MLTKLKALRCRNNRCAAVEMARLHHLVVAASSYAHPCASYRSCRTAAAVGLLEALCAPTLTGPFVALPLRPWAIGGAIRAYSAAAKRGCAVHAVVAQLDGARSLAR